MMMDEHVLVDGLTVALDNGIIDAASPRCQA